MTSKYMTKIEKFYLHFKYVHGKYYENTALSVQTTVCMI